MKKLTMPLARHTHLVKMYNGNSTGIHEVLKGAGFDLEKDYSVGQDKETRDILFMQAEGKVAKVIEKAIPALMKRLLRLQKR